MRTARIVLTAVLLLWASSACAQLGPDLGNPFAGQSPFTVSAVLDRTEVPRGSTFRIGIILDAATHCKIYRSSVKVTVPDQYPFRNAQVDVPKGISVDNDPNVPKGESVLVGRNVIIVEASTALHERPDLAPAFENDTGAFTVEFRGCSDKVCYPPETHTVSVTVPIGTSPAGSKLINQEYFTRTTPAPRPEDDLAGLARKAAGEHDFSRDVAEKGYLVAFLAAFASGVLVSLTPCVWPLIPIILAVVGASAEGAGWRRGLTLSLAYVLGMALTYAALGALAGALGKSVQGLTQSPWLVGVVCLAFVALALSMFGWYDIRIPSALAGKLQSRRATGVAGVLVMGIISGLVASPCVSAPLLGLFAGVATLGKVWVGALAGFIFALGMGIILIVAGTSSKALAALPRSGEWMVSVKHFFGWIMLGAAVWFSEMVFGHLAFVWLAVLLLLAAATYATYRFHTSAHLKRKEFYSILFWAASLGAMAPILFWSLEKAPIAWVADVQYGEGLARESKPAILDVTAAWCAYCKEMDRDVFSQDDIVAESRRFVMIRFDATVQTDAVTRFYAQYGVVAPPAFVFVRSDGTHVTVNGKQDRETFLKLMQATH